MSQTLDCQPACCDTLQTVNIPGNIGATGTAGQGAFTTTTASFRLPAAGATVALNGAGAADPFIYLLKTSWMAYGSTIYISDGTFKATFTVGTITADIRITALFLGNTGDSVAGSTMGTGALVVPSGTQPSLTGLAASGANSDILSLAGLTTPLSVAQGGTGQTSVRAAAKGLSTTYRLLGKFLNANFNTTADQAITGLSAKNIIRRINVQNASISLTAATGGFYTGGSKTGTIIVAAAQVYSALTLTTKFVDLTLAAGVTADVITATTIYFALTATQGALATADIYVYGEDLE